MKKEKRKLKKIDRLKAKKRKYEKFDKGREKRIQSRNEKVAEETNDWELTMRNEKVIDDFFRKKKRNNVRI